MGLLYLCIFTFLSKGVLKIELRS
uniref:Uncharacterized protein n=1 Tax=Anguilla anguilla TaxID=7936 RepID=A0A0E9U042_ANGAN